MLQINQYMPSSTVEAVANLVQGIIVKEPGFAVSACRMTRGFQIVVPEVRDRVKMPIAASTM
jgi:hypothetical protein